MGVKRYVKVKGQLPFLLPHLPHSLKDLLVISVISGKLRLSTSL